MYKLFNFLLLFIFLLSTTEVFASYEKLTKANYEKSKKDKAIVIYGVNWGRQWGCASLDNAQLQNLTFSRIDPSGDFSKEELVFNSPAKLMSKNASESYAVIVNAGEYALTEFEVKLAKSAKEIEHLRWRDNGEATGGTFKVNVGEIVYIGDFGLDCTEQPILWRYYIQKEDFESHVAGFKKKYKFVADKTVVYRLFQTSKFGQVTKE